MTPRLQKLHDALVQAGFRPTERVGELTIEVPAAEYLAAAGKLRDQLGFEQLTDLCGVDYAAYGDRPREGARFAAVVHLLSIANNVRLRLRVFCAGSEPPTVDSVIGIWASAAWFEREAFDLFGILFDGNPDLRRILTDYGFVGHPFRKDFPLSGNVEVRYDEEKKRVVYQPVSIEPRVLVPRVIRHDPRYDEAFKEASKNA